MIQLNTLITEDQAKFFSENKIINKSEFIRVALDKAIEEYKSK